MVVSVHGVVNVDVTQILRGIAANPRTATEHIGRDTLERMVIQDPQTLESPIRREDCGRFESVGFISVESRSCEGLTDAEWEFWQELIR